MNEGVMESILAPSYLNPSGVLEQLKKGDFLSPRFFVFLLPKFLFSPLNSILYGAGKAGSSNCVKWEGETEMLQEVS